MDGQLNSIKIAQRWLKARTRRDWEVLVRLAGAREEARRDALVRTNVRVDRRRLGRFNIDSVAGRGLGWGRRDSYMGFNFIFFLLKKI